MRIPFEGNPTFAPADMDKKAKVEASVDVVVIGSGGAGLSAAISIHDLGASVIVLEKQPITGGNTMLSAGGMNAANTRYQQALHIEDSVPLMIEDTMRGGGGLSDLELVTILAANSAGSVDWLATLGVDLSDVGKLAGATVNRAHRPKGGKAIGAHLIDVLRRKIAERGIDVRVNSTVAKIVEDDGGNVVGVQVVGRHSQLYAIEAKAVVLAAGGFSANPERVAFYCPTCAGMITSNQPGATGDGLDLAAAINGQLVQMEQVQIHPTLAAGSRILITEAVRGNGAVLVNREGLRFVNEMATRAVVSGEVLKQTGRTAFVVFDAGVRQALAQIEGYVKLGLVKEAGSLQQLAGMLAMPEAALSNTIDTYNQAYASAPNHIDPDFGRLIPRALNASPYYAIEVAPGIHYTMGGLKIDTQARVISATGTPIPGLFAAGEVTGGVHGKDRLGGNSISETITFGRIAGTNAAVWAEAGVAR
jgi:fumarate reductase flavoprotein subunit